MRKCEVYNDEYNGLGYEVKVWKNDYPNLLGSVPKEYNQAGYVYIPKRMLEDPTILAEVEEGGYTSYYGNDILCGMPVHGGITYHDDMPEYYKMGWDYQHLNDGDYSIEYVEAECKRCIDYFRNHPDIKWKE